MLAKPRNQAILAWILGPRNSTLYAYSQVVEFDKEMVGSEDFMEAVFPLGNVRIFSYDFQSFSKGKNYEKAESHPRKPENFRIGL